MSKSGSLLGFGVLLMYHGAVLFWAPKEGSEFRELPTWDEAAHLCVNKLLLQLIGLCHCSIYVCMCMEVYA